MFRGAATAGLTITLGLAAASALAGPASAATGHPAADTAASGSLPNPTANSQCDPSITTPPRGIPWAQQALAYQSLWQYTEGAGIKVALIDSGVDASPQLNGRVIVERIFVPAQAASVAEDCVGHGTAAAGIIAGQQVPGTSFTGVAPQATILSYKVSGSNSTSNTKDSVDLAQAAAAIGLAVQSGAKIINLSIGAVSGTAHLANLYTAVEKAISSNVIVVAAAGNDVADSATGQQQTGPFYPASFPGVLSVGAVDQNNGRASFSDTKSTVQVTAPGADITSTYPGTNGNAHSQVQGTSFAAPFVSGLAALVWARYPYLSAQQVVQRIEDTADGPAGLGTGHGLINPVQAITAVQPFGAPSAPPAKAQAVRIDRTPNHASEKIVVLSLTGGSLVVVLLVAAAAVIIPAGRRRRWQPGA